MFEGLWPEGCAMSAVLWLSFVGSRSSEDVHYIPSKLSLKEDITFVRPFFQVVTDSHCDSSVVND